MNKKITTLLTLVVMALVIASTFFTPNLALAGDPEPEVATQAAEAAEKAVEEAEAAENPSGFFDFRNKTLLWSWLLRSYVDCFTPATFGGDSNLSFGFRLGLFLVAIMLGIGLILFVDLKISTEEKAEEGKKGKKKEEPKSDGNNLGRIGAVLPMVAILAIPIEWIVRFIVYKIWGKGWGLYNFIFNADNYDWTHVLVIALIIGAVVALIKFDVLRGLVKAVLSFAWKALTWAWKPIPWIWKTVIDAKEDGSGFFWRGLGALWIVLIFLGSWANLIGLGLIPTYFVCAIGLIVIGIGILKTRSVRALGLRLWRKERLDGSRMCVHPVVAEWINGVPMPGADGNAATKDCGRWAQESETHCPEGHELEPKCGKCRRTVPHHNRGCECGWKRPLELPEGVSFTPPTATSVVYTDDAEPDEEEDTPRKKAPKEAPRAVIVPNPLHLEARTPWRQKQNIRRPDRRY